MSFVFFGTPQFAVTILEELALAGLLPALVVTTPDKPQGRHMILTPSEVKVWAEKHGIPVYQPINLKDAYTELTKQPWDLFIVAAYGKIIPEQILNIPKHKTLNVHPSLLPKLRGSAPIEHALLQNMKDTGVTIMRLDAEMDHGPIIAQEKTVLTTWPLPAPELEDIMAHQGGKLLASVIPGWIAGTIQETPQDHSQATYIQKIEKSQAEIKLTDDPYTNYLKYCAYSGWPRVYFFHNTSRIVITKAAYIDQQFVIQEVIPEGKKPMLYSDFLRGQH
jgi:methionyl-tRNA formyltransferase